MLEGIAGKFLYDITKGIIKGAKDLFKREELRAVLKGAFEEFEESIEGDKKDSEVVLAVFREFISDSRTINEFRFIFSAESHKVDYNLLEEIFRNLCDERGVHAPTFNFFQAVSQIIKEIENLLKKRPELFKQMQTTHLENIYQVLESRGTEHNLSMARYKYLNQLIRHHNNLRFTGIPDLKEKKDIALPSVFVMQRVVEDVPVEAYKNLLREHEGEGGEESAIDDEIGLQRRLRMERQEKVEPEKFDKVFEESDNRRFVILGNPGSGKTSLIKYLLLKSAQAQLVGYRQAETLSFPILMEIRKFENALKKTDKIDYCILDYLYDSIKGEYNLGLLAGFFENHLERGNALLLFDGLDEVADEVRRSEVQRMISAFIANYHNNNTVMITSRISGYSQARFSTAEFRHFTLQDFNDDEINEFIGKWYLSRLVNESEARQKTEDLKEALKQKPRIMVLARNPLILTIIGIVHRYETQLPRDRLILYDKATEVLLHTWDNVKAIIDEEFIVEYKRLFLEKVAFKLQMEEKGEEAGTVIDRFELYQILFPDFKVIFCCNDLKAKALVDEFLETIRNRSGLLVELAPDQFGFVHKTFQEYFAARFIANEVWINLNLQTFIDYVDKYIINPFWQETFLLALRALPNKQARKVMDHILKKDEEEEIKQYFYHHHYFVMKFLAEQGRWLNDRTFVKTQIESFFEFSWNEGKDRSYYGNQAWGRFRYWITLITDPRLISFISEFLLSRAEDKNNSEALRRACLEAVEKLGIKEKSVTNRLLILAENKGLKDTIRRTCAFTIGKLGFNDEDIIERLRQLANDENQMVELRSTCAYSIGRLDFKDEAIGLLLKLAEIENHGACLSLFRALILDYSNESGQLHKRLQEIANDESQTDYRRISCAELLGNIGMKEEAVHILLKMTENVEHKADIRRASAYAVGKLEFSNKSIIERLLTLAENKNNKADLRRACAFAVGKLGFNDNKVIDRLLALAEMEAQDSSVRRKAAYMVAPYGPKKQAIDILLRLAEDEKQHDDLRSSCATVVGKLGFNDEWITDRLLSLAENKTLNSSIRNSSASAIGILVLNDQTVVDRLLVLANDENESVEFRSSCAYAVGKSGNKDIAVDILNKLYNNQPGKYTDLARGIYSSLWTFTEF